jgi:hypothetical protein
MRHVIAAFQMAGASGCVNHSLHPVVGDGRSGL